MIKIGFDVEVAEGEELSATQLVDDLRTVLPKEWWQADLDYNSDDVPSVYGWLLTALYALDDGGRPLASDRRYRRPSYLQMQAQLEQEKKLTTRLDAEVGRMELQVNNLVEKNDNQMVIINDQKAALEQRGIELDEYIGANKANLMRLDNLTVKNDNQVTVINDYRHKYTAWAKQDNRNIEILAERQGVIDQLRVQLDNANQEAQNHAVMVAKIVEAMTVTGYDISGWGNDADLEELERRAEDIATTATVMRNASASLDASSTDLDAKLDNIRTER